MTIDLTKFCAHSADIRTHLTRPMLTAHGIIACDGWMLVCVPGTEGHPPCETDHITKLVDKYAALTPATDPVPLTGLTIPAAPTCPICRGTGTMYRTPCEDCDGEGDHTIGRHTYDCKECDGDGFKDSHYIESGSKPIACHRCLGEGKDHDRGHMLLGNSAYTLRFLSKLQTLPGCQIYPNGLEAAKFTFDGGWGALMPYRV